MNGYDGGVDILDIEKEKSVTYFQFGNNGGCEKIFRKEDATFVIQVGFYDYGQPILLGFYSMNGFCIIS